MLAVLFWPEWPAASLVLSIVCKFMVSPLYIRNVSTLFTGIKITSLDDVKTISQNDNNALKALALDHLGIIAGQLRLNGLKVDAAGEAPCRPLEEVNVKVNSSVMSFLKTSFSCQLGKTLTIRDCLQSTERYLHISASAPQKTLLMRCAFFSRISRSLTYHH